MEAVRTPVVDPATSTATASRWIGVGASSAKDSHKAGIEAATAALRGADPRLLVAFVSPAHDLQALLAGIRGVAPAPPLIGCSTSGEIATDGPGDAGVVVAALGGKGFSVSTSVARNASSDLRQAGATVAACAETGPAAENQILLLLTDGLGGDQQEVVRGAYSVVGGAVPLVGGCAGDDLAMKKTFQLFNDEVLEDAVIAAAISSDAPFGIGVQHGWGRVGAPFLVTESHGNRVHALDDRPALDVYLERLEAPDDVRTDAAAFTRFALTHPFGLSRRSGEEVRFIAEANFEDRSIGCIAEVPQGGLAWIMEGDSDSVLVATDAACSQAVAGRSGRAPLGFLAFDCIARRGVLGDEGIRQEVQRIGSHSQGAPVAGFYTYGEIARTRGVSGFHNPTLVVLAFS
ncbi:MAG TPA: FIST N-terminal domain-containing protein [Candidatus Acidoferrales bacterium]|nr:FIST N-terminal domain-containing protein [Candidatus Acidoferrales bacterium]